MNYLIGIYLAINAWTDGKRREIDCRYTLAFILILFVWHWKTGEGFYWLGCLPGICLWGLSRWKKGSIGEGDGILAAALGSAVGPEQIWNILTGGFFLAGCAGVFLRLTKGKRKIQMPFAPFLFLSYLLAAEKEIFG